MSCISRKKEVPKNISTNDSSYFSLTLENEAPNTDEPRTYFESEIKNEMINNGNTTE